jgi:hypothetical protein
MHHDRRTVYRRFDCTGIGDKSTVDPNNICRPGTARPIGTYVRQRCGDAGVVSQ